MNTPKQTVQNRPAESATAVTGAVVALVAYFAEIDDPGIIAAMIVIVGALPAAVTWTVNTVRGRTT